MPKVKVKGIGSPLSYPVPKAQLQKLIDRSTRAPYGKGSETITDLNVRRVWQLQSSDLTITGRQFTKFFDGIIETIKETMGLKDEVVRADLYKLLIYETGGFFLPHRDSEKEDKMFGTLVLSLPCPHRGGDLVISHSDKETVVSLENDSMSSIKWTAFFADCRHDVKPVTEGNRVCLVYNLMRSGARKIPIAKDITGPLLRTINKAFGIESNTRAPAVSPADINSNNNEVIDVDDDSEVTEEDDRDEVEDDDDDADVKITKKAKISTTSTTTTRVASDSSDDSEEDEDEDEEEEDDDEEDDPYTFDSDGGEVVYYETSSEDVSWRKKKAVEPVGTPEKIVFALDHVYSMANFTLSSLKGKDAALAHSLLAISEEAKLKLCLAFIHGKETGRYQSEPWHPPSKVDISLIQVRDILTDSMIEDEMDLWDGEVLPPGCLSRVKPYNVEAQEATGNEGGEYNRFYRKAAIVAWSTIGTGPFSIVKSVDGSLKILKSELVKLGGIDANAQASFDLITSLMASWEKAGDGAEFDDVHLTKMLKLLRSIKEDDRFVPKMLEDILKFMGDCYDTQSHEEAIMELLFQCPSMTPELVVRLLGVLIVQASVDEAMTLLNKLVTEATTSLNDHPSNLITLIPTLAVTLCDRLGSTVECKRFLVFIQSDMATGVLDEAQRQQLLDTTTKSAQAFLKSEVMIEIGITGKLKNVIHHLKAVRENTSQTYVTLDLVREMYVSVINEYALEPHGDYSIEGLSRIQAINMEYPDWVTSTDYDKLLKTIVNSLENIKSISKLHFLWSVVQAHADDGALFNLLLDNLCKVIWTGNTLVGLLSLLHKDYKDSPLYVRLWEHAVKGFIQGGTQCTCEGCLKITVFVESLDMTLHLKGTDAERKHFEIEATKFSMRYSTMREGRPPFTLVLTKRPSDLIVNLSPHIKKRKVFVDMCHSLHILCPSNTENDILNRVVNNTTPPATYPHTLFKTVAPLVLFPPPVPLREVINNLAEEIEIIMDGGGGVPMDHSDEEVVDNVVKEEVNIPTTSVAVPTRRYVKVEEGHSAAAAGDVKEEGVPTAAAALVPVPKLHYVKVEEDIKEEDE
ncbi:hypothetical protein SAMD00019534_072150 [Acytostelium subglobosum LB1]|uniref:hypothetical protein n=1 Tax=Acytostelium subglobosum LB1 TaxID=1410327 RepID=UPI000644DF71|nr:hypothetical protein SAMD00019534_072150 [Acytostelium subglobosum LB1]GAM24040.1 hypothetical protein SAMD00019534_072150 [Acytostelium subglobosum LB1]|eukprot:XP_012753076.1 hypothetical protein SAMD00019534_072150 [Acytostelium subglobosum LB1]